MYMTICLISHYGQQHIETIALTVILRLHVSLRLHVYVYPWSSVEFCHNLGPKQSYALS